MYKWVNTWYTHTDRIGLFIAWVHFGNDLIFHSAYTGRYHTSGLWTFVVVFE